MSRENDGKGELRCNQLQKTKLLGFTKKYITICGEKRISWCTWKLSKTIPTVRHTSKKWVHYESGEKQLPQEKENQKKWAECGISVESWCDEDSRKCKTPPGLWWCCDELLRSLNFGLKFKPKIWSESQAHRSIRHHLRRQGESDNESRRRTERERETNSTLLKWRRAWWNIKYTTYLEITRKLKKHPRVSAYYHDGAQRKKKTGKVQNQITVNCHTTNTY